LSDNYRLFNKFIVQAEIDAKYLTSLFGQVIGYGSVEMGAEWHEMAAKYLGLLSLRRPTLVIRRYVKT
jgi:hypothetical protein